MYLDDALLYNQGYMISINDLDSPLFYLFDYDSRSFKINMSFQHFHQFHEIHILLSGVKRPCITSHRGRLLHPAAL